MLAQMLQMEFDREYDAQLRREEKKFNGDSKGYLTFVITPLLELSLFLIHLCFNLQKTKMVEFILNDIHLFLLLKCPYLLRITEKCILLKTVTVQKMRLIGRILVMIPTKQVVCGVKMFQGISWLTKIFRFQK